MGNELLPPYQELLCQYEKLLRLSKKIFAISDSQGRDLKKREHDIKSLLDNSSQGFLTFAKDLLVDKEYSAECLRIFGRKICKIPITELLSGADSKLQQQLTTIFTTLLTEYFVLVEQASR